MFTEKKFHRCAKVCIKIQIKCLLYIIFKRSTAYTTRLCSKKMQAPCVEIKNRFKQFLCSFIDDQGKSITVNQEIIISEMCEGVH